MSAELRPEKQKFEEEYYQISPEILESFPKFRLPLNLYHFKEEAGALVPYYYAEQRLSREKRTELFELCSQGLIFVARSEHHIYAKHISKQLDLVLVDSQLKPSETALVFRNALTDDISSFFEQPVKPALEKLQQSVGIFIQYLLADLYRIKNFYPRLHEQYSLENAGFNAGILGTAIYIQMQTEPGQKYLEQAALGFFLYDLGLAKVPKFVREKKENLKPEEKKKILEHPLTGGETMRRLGITDTLTMGSLLEHHERLDGTGTPQGLKGSNISLGGRITGVTDTFLNLTLLGAPQNVPAPQAANSIASRSSKLDPKAGSVLQNIVHSRMFNKAPD